MEHSACAIKSDVILTNELRDALRAAVEPLEAIPETEKDWHPGSDGKVLDLVHSSLWPVVYSVSLIVPEKRIQVQKCLEFCGTGSVIPIPARPQTTQPCFIVNNKPLDNSFPTRCQWLPCDVDLTGGKPKIDSYINNVHPVRDAQLYSVIEKLIEASLPAWDLVYRCPVDRVGASRFETAREVLYQCKVPNTCAGKYCETSDRPDQVDQDGEVDLTNEECEDYEPGTERFMQTHQAKQPDPKDIGQHSWIKPVDVLKSGFFDGASRVQVIVKLANIHLTPEKPTYDGGTWHVEGQANEHICATALYYYDAENITECNLSFCTQADREALIEGRQGQARASQNPGAVSRGSAIISTAHVPPQQQDWWAETAIDASSLSTCTLKEMAKKKMNFPVNRETAKVIREELMKERRGVDRELRTCWT